MCVPAALTGPLNAEENAALGVHFALHDETITRIKYVLQVGAHVDIWPCCADHNGVSICNVTQTIYAIAATNQNRRRL